jgi:uncharacterized protein YaaQ
VQNDAVKLLLAIVQASDADRAAQRLRADGHRFTRLGSVGGFLETTNATFILAVEDEKVPAVVEVFRDTCSGREVEVPLVLTERLKDWQDRVVHYAGATILVVDLEEMIRI